MSVFAFARRGACVSVSILALGASPAFAQQGPTETNPEAQQAAPAAGTESVTPAGGTSPQAPVPAGTSELPELVVNDDGKKKKKKAAKTQQQPAAASTSSNAEAEAAEKPPAVTLGTAAPADTGTTTFDASNVQMRTTGGGDANTFLRNLPNVQYQNGAKRDGGANSQKLIDTKPQEISISGGRTYENNFIIDGVSVNNITGSADGSANMYGDTSTYNQVTIVGMSSQNIYVPSDFVGEATVIDSNASAEYGQFKGGAVEYKLMAPPTDGYHASVNASRETSETSSWLLGTLAKTNPTKRAQPTYEKTNLSASVGAPISSDFAFIAQASRKESESTKPMHPFYSKPFADENSDNIFLRFAATAKTDLGKFTFDTKRTDYFQRWYQYQGVDMSVDTITDSSSTKLEYEAQLSSVRADSIGLGGVRVKSRVYYNDMETQNASDSNGTVQYLTQKTINRVERFETASIIDGCATIDPATYTSSSVSVTCTLGGFGTQLQAQTDYGVSATVDGKLLFGSFKLGTELKQYEGRRGRTEDLYTANLPVAIGVDPVTGLPSVFDFTTVSPAAFTQFNCAAGDPYCSPEQFQSTHRIYRGYDTNVVLNALHAFSEIDQTIGWLNLRAGVRLDYNDYFKNIDIAPRLAGTVTLFEGVSVTAGYNRYYLGETLYYALRDGQAWYNEYSRQTINGLQFNPVTGTPNAFAPTSINDDYNYNFGDLATPFDDEYSAALRVRDPLLQGQWRFKYLERFGKDEFATAACAGTTGARCNNATNDGSSFYRSASAEYTKAWSNLNTPIFLNAAAVTGNLTWSMQRQGADTYLVSNDLDGDGMNDQWVYYNKQLMRAEQFDALTGNLDIPVRIGGTLSTIWLDGFFELNVNAAVNLAFQGVRYTGTSGGQTVAGQTVREYVDYNFKDTLKLDINGRFNVTPQAYIEVYANNITNSDQNTQALDANPWVLGRSFWAGTGLKF